MAAGLGFKTFTTGEVLTAADTNGYLMQGVLVFASAAARDAAITSPQEGQCCYLKDTDAVLTYSGAAWVGFDDSNAIQNAIVDAKGDLIAATAADTPARLAVGTNNYFLQAASGQATGLQWAGAYTTFTPTYTNVTIGNATNSGRYLRIGNFIHVMQKFVLGSTSAVTGNIRPIFPVDAVNADNYSIGLVYLEDSGTASYPGALIKTATTSCVMQTFTTSITNVIQSGTSATAPFTFTTGDAWHLNYYYEVA